MTAPLRARAYLPPGHGGTAFDLAILLHDERRVRRKLLRLVHGDEVVVDFPAPVTLEDGSALELEDGRLIEIVAGEEHLYEVRGRDTTHLMRLCWHLGNRHLKVQIEDESDGLGQRILILRDRVIRDMLIGLGASVAEVSEPFHPIEGAYHHSHAGEDHALIYRK
jgi:urease accessory protein